MTIWRKPLSSSGVRRGGLAPPAAAGLGATRTAAVIFRIDPGERVVLVKVRLIS
jgi:hypothetical protein